MDLPDLSRPRAAPPANQSDQEQLEEIHREMQILRARVEAAERSFEPCGWLIKGQYHPKGCNCPRQHLLHAPEYLVFKRRQGRLGFGRIRMGKPR